MSTIAAISTAPAIGGIGIIRMSGENSFDILNKIFVQKNPQNIENIPGYTMKYGKIIDPSTNKVIDEVFNKLNPTSMKEMGLVMKELNTKITNADMSLVSKLVKERLS